MSWRAIAISARPYCQKQIDFLRDALEDHFLFKALPLQTLEHVARLFRYVRTPAGKAIFGQGQRGQCFFICETGEYKASARRQRSRTPNPVL